MKGAVNFVRQEELTEDERREMERLGKAGMVVVTEKERDVLYKDELLPKQAAAAIEALLPFRFNTAHFVKMWKLHGVRPPRGAKEKSKTNTSYCIFSPPYNNYVYTQAYVRRCVSELDTREKFEKALGMTPVLKEQVTQIRKRSTTSPTPAEQNTAS